MDNTVKNIINDLYKKKFNDVNPEFKKEYHNQIKSGKKVFVGHISLFWGVVFSLWSITTFIFLLLAIAYSRENRISSLINIFGDEVKWNLPVLNVDKLPDFFNSGFVLTVIVFTSALSFSASVWGRYVWIRNIRKDHENIIKWRFYYNQRIFRNVEFILIAIYLIFLTLCLSYLPNIYLQHYLYYIFLGLVFVFFVYEKLVISLKEVLVQKEVEITYNDYIQNTLTVKINQNRTNIQNINTTDNSNTHITYNAIDNSKTIAINSAIGKQHNLSDIKNSNTLPKKTLDENVFIPQKTIENTNDEFTKDIIEEKLKLQNIFDERYNNTVYFKDKEVLDQNLLSLDEDDV